MNYQEAMEYINTIQEERASDYTLENVTALCDQMGRPDRKLRIIHIAGTNGKGSVGTYISNALAMCGYTVGRYVSPTVFDYRERIQKISGTNFGVETEWISEEDTAMWMTKLQAACQEIKKRGFLQPTAFEIETVMAFCQMLYWHVDVAVVEVGMGGLSDATNIIERPALTVFTRISLDHTAVLGDTLEQVAEQKFGIIKVGTPVVSARQESEVEEKLRWLCQRRGISLQFTQPDKIVHQEYSMKETRFSYCGVTYRLKQLGLYQAENAILAHEAMIRLAKSRFHKINVSSVQQAFYEAKWHGRFELISKSPYLILDGAHNPAGTQVLKQSLLKYFPGERFTFIVGVYQDKDYETMMKKMLPLARRVYTVRAAGERAMEPEELAQVVCQLCEKKRQEEPTVGAREEPGIQLNEKKQNRDIPVKACQSTARALEEIRRTGQGEKIVVFGSLSFLKDIYHYFDTARYI